MAVALPSLTGQLGHQRLEQAFDRFDALVTQAQQRSVAEGKPYVIVWTKDGAILLYPAELGEKERRAGPVAALIPAKDTEEYSLFRNASLSHNPGPNWIFWPSGNCEPVSVLFKGAVGEWTADYNPVSARGSLTRFIVR